MIEDWMRRSSKSGVKGVIRYGQRWKAVIHLPDKVLQLGVFDKVEEAGEVIRVKAIELYGEYAPWRFPKSLGPIADL